MIKKLEKAKGLSKYIINVTYTYYLPILKLWNWCLVFLLCYVLSMGDCGVDGMLSYMLWKCVIEIVPCAFIDEDVCHLN